MTLTIKPNLIGDALKDVPSRGEHPCKAMGGYADQEYCESWSMVSGCKFWDKKQSVCILNHSENRIPCDFCMCVGEKNGDVCKRCKGKGYIDLGKTNNGEGNR